MLLSENEQKELIEFSRKTLEAAFTDNPKSSILEFQRNASLATGALYETHPCFITLYTKPAQLRGCIGCLSTDTPLYKNVFEYTHHAAFRDPRFPPVDKEELPNLRIDIAVLGPLEPLPNLKQLEIGKHGLQVRHWQDSGVLLAKVAVEHTWTREEFLDHTCQKAGLDPAYVDTYNLSYFEELSFGE